MSIGNRSRRREDVLVDVDAVRRGVDPEVGLKEPLYEEVVIPEPFGPVSFEVDDCKVKEFAFCQDDYGAWYFTASPFGRRIGQAGIILNDLLQLFTLKYAASKVVGLHVEEHVRFHAPVFVGERVTLGGEYSDKYVRRGQGCVVMDARATGEDGRLLVEHRGIEIMRTVPGDVAGRGSATVDEAQRRRVVTKSRSDLARVEIASANLEPGIGVMSLHKRTTQAQACVFSRSGEWVHNIHNDLRLARAANLAVPIVQGQQLYCFAVELMTRFFGAAWFNSGILDMKFLNPVSVWEEIEVCAAVRSVLEDSIGSRMELDVWILRSDGGVAAVGWAEAVIASGSSAACCHED